MKSCRYNIFFDYEGQKVGFNSYTREYIILDPTLYLMYESSCQKRDFIELSKLHPDFYIFLVEKGFLVEENVDELELVKELVYKIDNDDSKFELHINPTMNCNFQCWYCYEAHIKDSKMDENTKRSTIKFVKNVFERKKGVLKQFHLSWFGGEPLLYYKKVVHPLLEQIYNLCKENGIRFSSGITTNGLLINQAMINTARKYNLSFFQITLDGNRNRHNKVRFISEKRGSYDAIITNIKLLLKNQLTVIARINCSPETLDGLKDIADDFNDISDKDRKFLSFDIHKVWQDENNVDDETLNDIRWYYRGNGFRVKTASFDTVLDSCYGDHRNHATLNYNGEVFKCTARDFTTKNSEGILKEDGEIAWKDKYDKRMNIKFKNKPCLECAIMPICNGGCSQQALEHEGVDYCVHHFDENEKRQVVINRFRESLLEE